MLNCVVIGTGIAGLASAIRLRAKGYNVIMFEANNYAGGKFRELQNDGYRFDIGPTVLTQPHLIDELFELHGKNPRDYFSYSKLKNQFKYFFEDGTCINAYNDTKLFEKEIEENTIDNKYTFRKYLKDIETKYHITKEVFIENSLHIPSNYLNKNILYGLLNIHKIDAFKTMNQKNKSFFKDSKTIQIFNHFATHVGSNPFVAPATLNVIQHLEINTGTYIPDNGMYSIVTSILKLAAEIGVKIEFNSYVNEIMTSNGKAIGVKVNNKEIPADIVISNMDIYYTYKKLLPNYPSPKGIKQSKSTSIIGFYWNINKVFPELETHNMFFSTNDRLEFHKLFNEKTISEDPSIYIGITSKHVKTDAPNNCENWFVMIHAPHIENQDWDELVKTTREKAKRKLNKVLKTNIENFIESESVLTPINIRDNYKTAFGSIYGNNSNNIFSAFLRHPNFTKKIKNLYFAGGTVHPGGGLPMCLNSAKIIGKMV